MEERLREGITVPRSAFAPANHGVATPRKSHDSSKTRFSKREEQFASLSAKEKVVLVRENERTNERTNEQARGEKDAMR